MLEVVKNIDWMILHGIQDTMKCEVLDLIMPKITLLGSAGFIWIIATLFMLISKKYRKYGVMLGVALVIGVVICSAIIKPTIARMRPCWIENVNLLINNPADYSFPSGHTLASVIGAFMLTAANRKFGFFAIPIASLICFSRLYLYVHFPSDVFTSVILGIAICIAVLFVGRSVEKKRHLGSREALDEGIE